MFTYEGATVLADALEINTSLTDLNLGYNRLLPDSGIYLASALAKCAGLTSLNLFSNAFEGTAGPALARAIGEGAPSLTDLNLAANELEDVAARALVGALRERAAAPSLAALGKIDLSMNNFGEEAAAELRAASGVGGCAVLMEAEDGGSLSQAAKTIDWEHALALTITDNSPTHPNGPIENIIMHECETFANFGHQDHYTPPWWVTFRVEGGMPCLGIEIAAFVADESPRTMAVESRAGPEDEWHMLKQITVLEEWGTEEGANYRRLKPVQRWPLDAASSGAFVRLSFHGGFCSEPPTIHYVRLFAASK